MGSIAENVAIIRNKMRSACLRVGRDPEDVRLVGVTKTVPPERVREGVDAGLTILGENYIQEAQGKVEALAGIHVSWHFIGHLQSNKAKIAARLFDCVHTIDSEKLARELDKQADKAGRRISVLLEVELGGENSKSGVEPETLVSLYRAASKLESLDVKGIMALPPFLDDPEEVRPYFRRLRELLDQLRDASSRPEDLTELSMGMSNDFEVAIEEGSTLVRVGTALFGSRPAK